MSVARLCRIGSPFNAVELPDVDYVQSFDVMYLAHIDHPPEKLIRRAHNDWEFETVNFGPTISAPVGLSVLVTNPNQDDENDGNAYFPQPASYVVTAVNDATGQESRPSAEASGTNDLSLKRNKNTISWSAAAGADRYRVYKSDNQQDFGYIGTTSETSFTDDNIGPDLTDGPLEASSPFADGNNPSTVTFFEQRLLWARTRARPNAVFTSRTSDFENMDVSRPLKADDAITFALAANKVNSVNSLVPLDALYALTSDARFKISGSNDDYLSANPPPRIRRQAGRGSNRLKPIVVDEVVFFRPAIGSEVRTLNYSFEIDGLASNDVSIFSPDFFKGFDIASWAYAEEPLSIIWATRSDGVLLAFTWQKEQQVWGWTVCETNGFVEQVAVIQEGGEDRVYLVVRRTINGVERRFLERMASAKWEDINDACYLDCAMSFAFDEPTRFVSGIWHLEGESVDVLADGFTVRGLTVERGTIDLGENFEARRVTVGLPYVSFVETLPLIFQAQEGWSAGRRQQSGEAVIQVVRTRGIEVGRRPAKMYPPKPRGQEPLGQPNRLNTGSYLATTEPLTAGETTIMVRSVEPLPMTVTAIYLDPIVTE